MKCAACQYDDERAQEARDKLNERIHYANRRWGGSALDVEDVVSPWIKLNPLIRDNGVYERLYRTFACPRCGTVRIEV